MNRFQTLILLCSFLFATTAMAQGPGPELMKKHQEQNQKRTELMNEVSQLMQAVGNQHLHQELEIVPDQVAKMRELAVRFQSEQANNQKRIMESQQELQQLFRDAKWEEAIELSKKMYEPMEDAARNIIEEADTILLPHQTERIRQIAKQQALKFRTHFRDEFGIPFALADELELDEATKRQLRDTTEQARKEFYEEVEKLRAKTNEKILATLPKPKQEKLKEIVGEFYDHEKQSRKSANARRKQMEEQQRARREREREQERN